MAARAAVSGVMPMSSNIPPSSASSASGLSRISRRSATTSLSIASFCVFTDAYSPSAIENAPATRPARPAVTTISGRTPAAPMPATSETLVTRPSIAPKVAARSHPPDTSAWVWPTSSGPRSSAGTAGSSCSSAVVIGTMAAGILRACKQGKAGLSRATALLMGAEWGRGARNAAQAHVQAIENGTFTGNVDNVP